MNGKLTVPVSQALDIFTRWHLQNGVDKYKDARLQAHRLLKRLRQVEIKPCHSSPPSS
jgi:hypothetical protein